MENKMTKISAKKQARIDDLLASENYGSRSTPGPRQVSILISLLTLSGGRGTVGLTDLIQHQGFDKNPSRKACVKVSLACLRARRLVSVNGDRLRLTVTGLKAAELASRSARSVEAGVGLVLTGLQIR